jgi:pimeloyl-ACP methyl ester carboxylesterase
MTTLTTTTTAPKAAEERTSAAADERSAAQARPAPTTLTTRYLARPGGRIAYDVSGEGPLVVAVPGMGDIRTVYRFLAPQLVEAGYRVATMDLRGHGESDTTFDAYDDVAAATDIIALVDELGGGPAILVGNSMGAGAAAWAAAEAPEKVRALVLIGPFVRNAPVARGAGLAFRLLLLRPWGPAAWQAWYRRLYPGRAPEDLAQHQSRIREGLRRPGAWKAFSRTTRTSHEPAAARLGEVNAPTFVVMGDKDPDFKDPRAEAAWIAETLRGRTLIVEGSGHYPHAEYPEVVGPAVVEFLRSEVAGA